MSGTTMVVVIIAIIMCAEAIKHWSKARAKEAAAKNAGLNDEAAAKIKDLEERVRVLERIATDKGTRLKEEIDAL